MALLEVTSWQPMPQAAQASEQALANAVRCALPAHAARALPDWALGELRWDAAAASAMPGCQLRWLEWHWIGAEQCQQRAVGAWRFRGEASMHGQIIDFYGAYLRDQRLGWFREFQIHTKER